MRVEYFLHNPSDLVSNFSFLKDKVITGKFLSFYRDGKIIRIKSI